MVKRKQLDLKGGEILVSETETKQEFFCDRCGYHKNHRVRAFWKSAGGDKVICGPCYEDVMKRRRLQGNKEHSDEQSKRQRQAKVAAVQELVFPPLLELLAGPEAGRAEAYRQLVGEVSGETAAHFVASLAAAVQPYEAGSQCGGPLEAVRAARAAGEALAAALGRLGLEAGEAERLVRRATWHEELASDGAAWASLDSLADLPRLAAVLSPSTAEQITGTLAGLLPTLELQAPLNPPLATAYFDCVLTYARLPAWPPAVPPFLANLATSPAFTARQQARLARLAPLAPRPHPAL